MARDSLFKVVVLGGAALVSASALGMIACGTKHETPHEGPPPPIHEGPPPPADVAEPPDDAAMPPPPSDAAAPMVDAAVRAAPADAGTDAPRPRPHREGPPPPPRRQGKPPIMEGPAE